MSVRPRQRLGKTALLHITQLHGCTIGDRCLIGINATIMDGAKIGNNCIVAGHTIVTEGSEFPDNTIIAGVPVKQSRPVTVVMQI